MTVTLMAVVKNNGREIEFHVLSQIREMLDSRTVAQKMFYINNKLL
jgi:hypothetical protein